LLVAKDQAIITTTKKWLLPETLFR